MGETDQSRKIENLKSKSFKIEQLSETENTSNTATEDTQGPTKQYWAIYFPPFYRHRLVHYLTPYQILWTFCGWISGQCKCKWGLSDPSLTEAPRSLLPYNGKGFIFSDDNSPQDDFFYKAHDPLSKSCSYIFPPPYPPFSPQMLPHLCPSYQSEHQWLLRPRPTHRNLLTSPCQSTA